VGAAAPARFGSSTVTSGRGQRLEEHRDVANLFEELEKRGAHMKMHSTTALVGGWGHR
jgi:hypothetical protein